jgi:hypothetical protein
MAIKKFGFRFFSLPATGSFHLSLTVLNSRGWEGHQGLGGGAPLFGGGFTGPPLLKELPSTKSNLGGSAPPTPAEKIH